MTADDSTPDELAPRMLRRYRHTTPEKPPETELRQFVARRDAEAAELKRKASRIIITSTPEIQGFEITEYLGLDGVEFVLGTGPLTEFMSELNDLFGQRSKIFESRLRAARLEAMFLLQVLAVERGADAVVGVDIDYAMFNSNRPAIIATGTLVKATRRR